jgi:hypothetical protein
MTKQYDDARFGVEKVLTFPGHCDCINAGANISQIIFSEDVTLLEFGVVITETVTAAGDLCTVQLRESSTVLATISIPSASAIGAVVTTTTLTATNISSGDTLIWYRDASCQSVGECDGYIKYRERY